MPPPPPVRLSPSSLGDPEALRFVERAAARHPPGTGAFQRFSSALAAYAASAKDNKAKAALAAAVDDAFEGDPELAATFRRDFYDQSLLAASTAAFYPPPEEEPAPPSPPPPPPPPPRRPFFFFLEVVSAVLLALSGAAAFSVGVSALSASSCCVSSDMLRCVTGCAAGRRL